MVLSKNHERLSRIFSHLDLMQDLPLLKSASIEPASFIRLKNAVNYFFYANLTKYFKDKQFEIADDMVERYPDEIQALPCITPNGMVVPKLETFLEYNLVYHSVTSIISSLGIDDHIYNACKNIHLRLVDGNPNPKIDSRPYASVKMHSDIWVGDPVNIIQVFIPLLGDTERTGMNFFEPLEFPEEYIRTLSDYEDGASLKSNAKKYDTVFKKGEIFFMDSFLLHQTVKRSGGLRLSIDFRLMPNDKILISRPEKEEAILLNNYIDLDEWYDIGQRLVLTAQELLAPFKESKSGKRFSHLDFEVVEVVKNKKSFPE
jgi:hypothetical protein